MCVLIISVVIPGWASEGGGGMLWDDWLGFDCELYSWSVGRSLPASLGEISWSAAHQGTMDKGGPTWHSVVL